MKKNLFLLPLFALLLFSAFWVHRSPPSKTVVKPVPVHLALTEVAGFEFARALPLDEPTIKFLDLDDYAQLVYEKETIPVTLYVGYYFSLEKISAAHSPLVCFPGQGWKVTPLTERRIKVGEHEIHYAETIATLGTHQELVLYWYQAHEKTIPHVYRNKIYAVYNKLKFSHDEHAFVRVTVPILNGDTEIARSIAEEFVISFYPEFLEYVNSTPLPANKKS